MLKSSLRKSIAALALAGTAVLAPLSAAHADPSVNVWSDGVSVIERGGVALGEQITFVGTGCTAPEGQQTYMGEFMSIEGDPSTTNGFKAFDAATAPDGSFTGDAPVTLGDNPPPRVYARWYCATASVDSLDDPEILWVGPLVTVSIENPQAPQALRSSLRAPRQLNTLAASSAVSTVAYSAAAADPAQATMSLTVDPDALPAVDRIDILGPKAAALKSQVDARYATDSKSLALSAKVFKSNPTLTKVIDRQLQEQYVKTAASVLGAKVKGKDVTEIASDLVAGEIRVKVVEDIALTVHDADYYNAR